MYVTSHEFASAIFVATTFILISTVVIIKTRYRKFDSRSYVLRFRNGILKNSGTGGGYFLLPLIDHLVVLPATYQRVEFSAKQEIIFKPKFAKEEFDKKIDSIQLSGFVMYQIRDPDVYYSKSAAGSSDHGDELVEHTNRMIASVIEGHLKHLILEEPLDQLYRDRKRLVELIKDTLGEYTRTLSLDLRDIRISEFQLNYS